ncbi:MULTISPECIES: hypothetical protein [unclassified Microcoleus]|uniref:hypothetical protein n=1 Tax=unclassified Microcoleus TaxID=2642155 RepID=UPI001D3A89F2|nr:MULTISPECIES: hypothetical protein [unclassified Microcoleus]MCC3464628.1 hypothetical protein [Microcoleus sp. PH2017_06_SFM_O_A]
MRVNRYFYPAIRRRQCRFPTVISGNQETAVPFPYSYIRQSGDGSAVSLQLPLPIMN